MTPSLEPAGPLLTLLHKAFSHELPNQFVAIGGLARMLELEAGDRLGDAREYLERLSAAGQRCHQLVKELAEVVRLLRLPLPAEPASLAEAVRNAVEELRPRFPDRQVRSSFAENALTVCLPEPVLHFALTELLKYSFEASQTSPIQAESRREAGSLVLEIRHASALTPAQVGKLLEPFAGENLALASAVLAGHGGILEVESTDPPDTTLRVTWKGVA